MNKTRFALTSVLLLLGFGLLASDCDCDCDGSRTPQQNVLPPGAVSNGAGALPHAR